jgi:hypothetical protein
VKFVTQREFDMVREHLRELGAADQRALQIKQEADDKAKALEQDTDSYYRAGQNEWRGESSDRAAMYVTRTELKPIQDWVLAQQGRSAGISAQTALLMGLAGLVLTALLVYLALVAH